MSVDVKIESFEELMTDIQCHACKAVPQPSRRNCRYRCYVEGHALCNTCSLKIACPCGSGIGIKSCSLIRTLLKSLPWYCCHFKHGCREMFRSETALAEHKIDCIYRQVKCCYSLCDQKILVKDYLDHYSKCRPNLSRERESAQASIALSLSKSVVTNGYSYFPLRFNAHGGTFFLVGIVKDNHFRMWMLMLTPTTNALKNYEWKLQVNGVGDEEFTFRGEPFGVDKHYKDVLKEQSGFSIGCMKLLKIQEKLGKTEVMIEIRNLKEEFKDEDVESGVSSDSDSDE